MIRPANMLEKLAYQAQTGYAIGPDFNGIVSVDKDRILAFAGYDHWTKSSCWMHVWVPDRRGLSREALREGFRYPFIQLDLTVVLAVVPSFAASEILATRLGFSPAGSIRDGWDIGVPLNIHEMRRDACPWLGDAKP